MFAPVTSLTVETAIFVVHATFTFEKSHCLATFFTVPANINFLNWCRSVKEKVDVMWELISLYKARRGGAAINSGKISGEDQK